MVFRFRSAFLFAGWCGVLASGNAAETAPAQSKLPPAVAAEKQIEEAKRKHIQPGVAMLIPPPSPRVETKPPSPDPGYVWVAGHWAPVKGTWQWKPGEWQIPATPESVWIEGKYDTKTKLWSPGYWQPDRPDSYGPEPAAPPAKSAK